METRRVSRALGSLATAAVLVLFLQAPALAADQPRVVKSKHSFTQTVSRFKNAVKKAGLAIVFEANHKNMMAMVGIQSPDSITLGFAKPQMGAKLLGAEPRAAVEMPLRVAVRVLKDGSVAVIYYQPSYLLSHYKNPKLAPLARKMDKMVDKFVKAATE